MLMKEADIRGNKHGNRLASKIRAEFPAISQKRALRLAAIMREDLMEIARKTGKVIRQSARALAYPG